VKGKVPGPTEAVSVIFLKGMRKTTNRAPQNYESKSITALPTLSRSPLLMCRQIGMPKLMEAFLQHNYYCAKNESGLTRKTRKKQIPFAACRPTRRGRLSEIKRISSKIIYKVKFEVLTDVIFCFLLFICFSTLKIKVFISFQISANIYHTTWCHILEDSTLHSKHVINRVTVIAAASDIPVYIL
jgi:hypothetical protein